MAPSLANQAKRSLAALGGAGLLAVAFWFADSFFPGAPPTVAVLPLRNISEDPLDSTYLAEGISQAVVTRLVQAGLRVTPWDTARRYADSAEPPEVIARELNADAVLVGTFQLSGDRILTSLSLVEADSGLLTWAEQFEMPYQDIFQMQREIALGAARGLKTTLTGDAEEALAEPESRSVDAYDLYLQGAHVLEEGGRESNTVALPFFHLAVEKDPSLVEAHLGLGAVHYDRYFNGWGGGIGSLDEAEASFERALELNPASPKARRGLVLVHWERGSSENCLIQGREAARHGLARDVEKTLARATAYLLGGLPDRSVSLFLEAIEQDPRNQAARWYLVLALTWSGRFDEGIEAGDDYFDRFGDDAETHVWVGVAHDLLGHHERARAHYAKASGDTSASEAANPKFLGLLFGGLHANRLGERERAEDTWRRGVSLAESSLRDYADNVRIRLFLACFHTLLGERASLPSSLGADDFNAWDLYYVAAALASVGETERSAELLRGTVRNGRISPHWKLVFDVAAVPPLLSSSFDRFLEEYEALERRLRGSY
jgi:TolB-like protein